jgi:hypothetical protein
MSYETPDPARQFARELGVQVVCTCKALARVVEFASQLGVPSEPDVDVRTLAERRDLADAFPRATWSAVLENTRELLLDFLTATDAAAIWQARR